MKKGIIAIAVMMALVFAGMGIAAEEKKTNISTDKPEAVSPEAQAVKDLAMAEQLAEYGRRFNDPVALFNAAQIIKNTAVQEQKREKTTEGEKKAEAGQKSGALNTPEKLLADAKAMAEKQGNDAVVSMIDKESKIAAQRGRVGGPIETVERVYPGNTDVYKITFRGQQSAVVGVISDGDCDIDLYVYDENGNLITSDTSGSAHCYAEWTPRWTGTFYIKVQNRGGVYADYVIATN